MFRFLPPEILCFGPQAQIFTFFKRRISEIPKIAIIPKVLKNKRHFCTQSDRKAKIGENYRKNNLVNTPVFS